MDRQSVSHEIGDYLYNNYQCFLETHSEMLELHGTFLDLETTIVNYYPVLLHALQANLESETPKSTNKLSKSSTGEKEMRW
jgi:hypothetical protein